MMNCEFLFGGLAMVLWGMHGALGYWDELIFVGVAVVFTVVVGLVWWSSRRFEPEYEEEVGES